MTIKQKINALLAELNRGMYEKQEVMALVLLASIAGENSFLLGSLGLGKSLIPRRLTHAYTDGQGFEYFMSRFSSLDEIFGPVSFRKYRSEDTYERLSEGYLPSASVIFFEELWRMGHSVQNALFRVLDQRLFRSGTQEIKLPAKALIAASKELPGKDEGLESLWESFLVRIAVQDIQDEQNFDAMISSPLHSPDDPVTDKHKITAEEYEAWGKKIDAVIIPKTILNVIHAIRDAINQYNQKEENLEHQFYVSDQRWHKIMHVLRTSAFLNDRDAVDPMDCFLIAHCIWNEREQITHAAHCVHEAIEQHGYSLSCDFSGIKQQIAAFRTEVHENTFVMKSTKVTVLETVYNDYYEMLKPPAFAHLIKQSDFQNLSDEHRRVTLYYWNDTYKQVQSAFRSSFASGFSLLLPKPGQVMLGACLVKKGDSEFSIFIDDTEYQLKTSITEEKQQVTKKPGPKVKEAWDKQGADLAQHIKAVKDQLERQQNMDREQFRTHLFVKPELAAVLEPHLDPIFKDIEDMEREIKAIQDLYKSPKRKKST